MRTLTVLLGMCVLMAGCGEPTVLFRVNAGADAKYVDQNKNTWLADQDLTDQVAWGAIGGDTVIRDEGLVKAPPAPEVYQAERYGMEGYQFTVPNGTYTLRLHFAETYEGIVEAGERVFSVKVNGKEALKDVDPFKEGGGFAKPVVKEIRDIAVTDGKLKIEFVENVQSPEINGIEVLKH